jgi:hypothetical protein
LAEQKPQQYEGVDERWLQIQVKDTATDEPAKPHKQHGNAKAQHSEAYHHRQDEQKFNGGHGLLLCLLESDSRCNLLSQRLAQRR